MLVKGMLRDGGGGQCESLRRKALAVQGWGRDLTDCSGMAGATGVGSGVPGREGRPARLPRQPGPPHRLPALSDGSRHGGHTLSTRQRGPACWTPPHPGSFPLPTVSPSPAFQACPAHRGKPTSPCFWAPRARVLFILSTALGHRGRLASSTAWPRAGPWPLTSGLNTPHSCCPFKDRRLGGQHILDGPGCCPGRWTLLGAQWGAACLDLTREGVGRPRSLVWTPKG